MKNKQQNKEFVKNWARAEKLSLEIYQEISNLNEEFNDKNELKKYSKIGKKINKLFEINNLIIKSLEFPTEKLNKNRIRLLIDKINYKKHQKWLEENGFIIRFNYKNKIKIIEIENTEENIDKLIDKIGKENA